MTKVRILVFLATIIVVGTIASFFGLYARGYRFDLKTLKFAPNGILVIKSDPDGAQIFIDGELETATNATLRLAPGTYDVSLQKDGYLSWNKRLIVEKEVVTEANAQLFRGAPSLSPITFSGVVNPTPSLDNTKIAYTVPLQNGNGVDKAGIWFVETVNLPIGFTRDPKRISDGNLVEADLLWSPDGRELLVTTSTGVFLLNAGEFTPQANWVNVASQRLTILSEWEEEKEKKLLAQIRPLPQALADILANSAVGVSFSPDETKVLYTASINTTIPEALIRSVPGASTQKQERNIKEGQTYVYDIKEDRNFLIESSLDGKRLSWFPTSSNLIVGKSGEIVIMDSDGTNAQTVYSGTYEAPHAFPTFNRDRILFLTNLGANTIPNLYSLSLK